MDTAKGEPGRKIRFAVVGAGHIAQTAVLPAFERAKDAELAAIVTGDPEKARVLGERYGVKTVGYDGYEALLDSGEVDAVYVATPNHLHCEHTVIAAKHGVHVLCEKPMAVTEEECLRMHEACEEHGVKLMIAYRLHFDRANLEARRAALSELGEPRFVSGHYSQAVKPGDVRLLETGKGGGPMYDIGVYCIDAARYLFDDEPVQASAFSSRIGDPRFDRCDTSFAVNLRFSRDRLASFAITFDGFDDNRLYVVGTKGLVELAPAFEYAAPLKYAVATGEHRRVEIETPVHDQFSPELDHLASCIRSDEDPEPDWRQGTADVRVIRALIQSADDGGRPVDLEPMQLRRPPGLDLVAEREPVKPPPEVDASGPRMEH